MLNHIKATSLFIVIAFCSIGCNRDKIVDFEIFNEVLPILIENEYHLKPHIPPLPPTAADTERISDGNLLVIEDSFRKVHNAKWRAYLDTVENIIVLDSVLSGKSPKKSFVRIERGTVDNEFFDLYLKLISGSQSDIISNNCFVEGFKNTTFSFYFEEYVSNKNLIGYLSLSRIILNKEQTKACFMMSFLSKTKVQGFEMFVFIEKIDKQWKINSTSRNNYSQTILHDHL